MSATVTFTGLEELKEVLRNLPAHLAQEAGGIVTRHANEAAATVRSEYPIGPSRRHKKGGPIIPGGTLRKGVKVEPANVSGAGASARVKSTAQHAWLYENGSQVRNYNGANRGAMPPHHTFVRTVVKERREMVEDLIKMVEREGLVVRR